MTKSNSRAIRRRQTNRRITLEYDAIQQQAVRNYRTRHRTKLEAPMDYMQAWWVGMFKRTIRHFNSFFSRLFQPSKRLLGLDLRRDGVDRFGAFDPGRQRNVGAAMLRDWFPNLGTLVSTRDGKMIR